jgi:transposase
VNQIRGLLAEHGLVVARDISRIRRALAQIADGDDNVLGVLLVELVRDVREELNELDQRVVATRSAFETSFSPMRCASVSARSRRSGR